MQCTRDDTDRDPDYNYDDDLGKSKKYEYIRIEYKRKVVTLAEANPKWNFSTLQRLNLDLINNLIF